MTIEEQAKAIVDKYRKLNWYIDGYLAINCAITEVQAIINSNPYSNPLNTNPIYSTMQYWMDILEHLKQM